MSALLDQWAAQLSDSIKIVPPFSRDVPLRERGSPFDKARDSQRSKAYQWERAVTRIVPAANRVLSQPECHDLLHRVWTEQAPHADVERLPSLVFLKRKRYLIRRKATLGTASALFHRIELLEPEASSLFQHGQRVGMLLHEIAHLLTPATRHGPQWVQQFAYLLHVYADAPIPYVVGMAAEHRVKGASLVELQTGIAA